MLIKHLFMRSAKLFYHLPTLTVSTVRVPPSSQIGKNLFSYVQKSLFLLHFAHTHTHTDSLSHVNILHFLSFAFSLWVAAYSVTKRRNWKTQRKKKRKGPTSVKTLPGSSNSPVSQSVSQQALDVDKGRRSSLSDCSHLSKVTFL